MYKQGVMTLHSYDNIDSSIVGRRDVSRCLITRLIDLRNLFHDCLKQDTGLL